MEASCPGRRGSVSIAYGFVTVVPKCQKSLVNQEGMAERVGFKPTVRIPVQRFSRPGDGPIEAQIGSGGNVNSRCFRVRDLDLFAGAHIWTDFAGSLIMEACSVPWT